MTSRAEQEPVTERIKGHASMAGRQGVRILGGSLTLPFIFPRWLLVSCVVYGWKAFGFRRGHKEERSIW